MRAKIPFIIVGLLLLGYVALEVLGPKPMDWSPSYGQGKETPFGSQLLYEGLPDLFPGGEVTTVREAPSKVLKEFEKGRSNYLIFAEDLDMSQADTRALLDFARRGNSVFVAADMFSGPFADSLGIENRDAFLSRTDNLFDAAPKGQAMRFPELTGLEGQEYPLLDYVHYNYLPESFASAVLSEDKNGSPIMIRFAWGEGEIFVHTIPLAFTNYYMVDPINHAYISQALSFLPEQPVIWDEYYKPGRVDLKSSVAYVLDNTSLKWAWILTLVTVGLYVIFEGKRRQRIIPLQEPMHNMTLEFTETVSRLYYGHADHKNIAEKKIKFFLEYVRGRWMLSTQDLNNEFEMRLSAKSGVPNQEVRDLVDLIKGVQDVKEIEAQTLLLLNRKIESFYVNSQ